MADPPPSSFGMIFRLWWPLAGSWLFMGLELPLIGIVLSRVSDSAIHLAAFGGVVFPLSLMIEAPIIMIISASTALSTDIQAYRVLRNFTWGLGGTLLAAHALVAFTPLYDWLVVGLLGPPAAIVDAGRTGLQIMTPWTLCIGVRRFWQGIVIRTGSTRCIGFGTLVRICLSASLLLLGLQSARWSGIVVATTALVIGVMVEAVWMYGVARSAIRNLPPDSGTRHLSFRDLWAFYVPLAVTPLMTLATLPIISAALSRMPLALESLAVWPVLNGMTFVFRSVGFALQEVVIALGDKPGLLKSLEQFSGWLSCCTTGLLLGVALTPMGAWWFDVVTTLSPALSPIALNGLWLALWLPLFSPWTSYWNGILVRHGSTRSVTQAVLWYVVGSSCFLGLGILYGRVTGLYVGLAAMLCGLILQTGWLFKKSAPFRRVARCGETGG